jgi:hypothetical protein
VRQDILLLLSVGLVEVEDIPLIQELLEINIPQILHYFQHLPQDKEIQVEIMGLLMLVVAEVVLDKRVKMVDQQGQDPTLQVKEGMDFALLLLVPIIQ